MPRKMQTKNTLNAVLRPFMQVMAALVFLTLVAATSPARAEPGAGAEAGANPATGAMLETTLDKVLVVRSAGNDDRFLGSAFLWGDGAVAVTNAHVVGGADEVRLVDAGGKARTGVVIGVDAVRDVAVIAVTAAGAGLLPGPTPALGAEVWAIGAPLGADFSVTRGMVSAHARQVEAAVPIRFLQHDAAVNPGSSGGPLVDAAGRLVGMNSRIADGSRHYIGISYAIAVTDLARIVEGLIAETLLPFPRLGLQLRPVSREIADALALEPTGVLIDRVMPGELAERAGLRAGDIILTAGASAVTAPGDLAFAIEAALASGKLMLGLHRAGQAMDLAIGLHAPDPAILATRGLDGASLARTSSYRLEALGLTLGAGGRIDAVTENSPALFAGIIRGDVIVALNGHALNLEDLRRIDITAPALLLLKRAGGSTLHVVLNPWDTGDGIRIIGGANVLDPAVVVF